MVWHPSGDTPLFVLINSIHGSSPDLHNHHQPHRPSLTLADPWVAIFSSLVVLACLTVTLDEPELKSWFVNEVIRPQPRSLSWIFILLLNNSVYGSSLLKAAPRISILFGNQLFVRKVVELRWVAKWTTQRWTLTFVMKGVSQESSSRGCRPLWIRDLKLVDRIVI